MRRLNLELFDINNILKNGVHLTGSEGKEYDTQEEGGPCNVSKQKQILNSMIGLDVTHRIGIEIGELLTADDFTPSQPERSNTVTGVSFKVNDIFL